MAPTFYRIFRNTTNDSTTAVVLGTTVEGSFFDPTAVVGQTYFFWVRGENGTVVSGLSQPEQGTRANGLTNFGPVPPLNPPPVPPGNPVTAAKTFLGKTLFWDEQLSSTRTVACGSCHFATSGGSDSRSSNATRSRNPGADGLFNTADDVFASPGVPSNNFDGTYNWSTTYGFAEQVTGRKSRSYIDAGYANLLFWDGRATGTFTDPLSGNVVLPNGAALESQVLGPPVSATEMAHAVRDWNDVASRVATSKPLALSPSVPAGLKTWIGGRSYPDLFLEVFGTTEVTPARIAMAIATFERTVYSDRTPFDAAVSQITPLTQAETRGQGVFNASRCNVCHAGSLFSDNAFHNIGLRPQAEDTGRGGITGNPNQIGEFRTPSLRNVELRGPYFHNGSKATLTDVVEFYNRGGDFDAPNINHNLIRPLNLSAQQKADLIAFLSRPLTDPRVAAATAPFDRPTLYSESNRVPQIVSPGTAGSGGLVPQVTSLEPPLLGNPSFTVGVSQALGQAQAVLVIDTNDPGAGPGIPASGSFARRVVTLSGSGAGQGFGSVSLQIPASSTVLGASFFGRWYVPDANAPGGVAATPAFKFTIFGEAPTVAPNAIENTDFFVSQHYRDFLSREPDAEGLNFWSNEINSCGLDQACLDYKRQLVSAAYFLSIEFQETGFYAIRIQRSAFGKKSREGSRVTFGQFVPDAAFVGAGVVVGQTGYQQLLDQNKQNYATQIVSSAEFATRFPASQSATQFVNALYASAGVTPTQAELDAAVIAFGAGGSSGRAAALRKVAESNSLGQAELNPAFVLMEYFGYLRRDPDAAGYNFWLAKLEQFGGNYVQAEMVKSFIVSGEYRSRFGLP
ncbi:MAG TPA: cytochrome c peroxidase [Pyrinomonadaceae bacterium]|nr:cytochrome c peroxidase [Pyrinomonadaceae bacterium]